MVEYKPNKSYYIKWTVFNSFFGSSPFVWGCVSRNPKIIVGLTWSLCGHDSRAKPPDFKRNRLSQSMLSCPPLHIKPPKIRYIPTPFSEERFLLSIHGSHSLKKTRFFSTILNSSVAFCLVNHFSVISSSTVQ